MEQPLTPELYTVEQQIRGNTSNGSSNIMDLSNVNSQLSFGEEFSFGRPIDPILKPTFERTNYDILEAYAPLSDGTFVAKYPTIQPGADNQEYHAQRQGAGEKWANGLLKFGGKTLNAVVGGTVGTVYGVGSWISNGSFESVYNNDFSNWLADLDVKMNNNLANYYSKQEQEKGVFGQMGTANFWSDKVLGGLSFTAGAIVSEGIWAWATGGASLATAAARWSARSLGMQRLAKAVSKVKELIKTPNRNVILSPAGNVDVAIQAGNLGSRLAETANTLRFAMTSAGYEASVEALQFRREQEENFLHSFQQINGRMPNADEVAEFKVNLETASNAVFATNMAIVGSSNLVTLGNIFKIKSPVNTGLKDFVNKTAYGVGTADDALKRIHRINRKALPLVKNMITEGLYEEGSQSMTTNIADQWMKYTYDENRIGESFDMSGALYEAFAEQYGTTEGWKENLVGMIIGAIGEAGTGNSRADLKKEIQTAEQRQAMAKTFTSEALSKKFLAASQIANFNQQAEKAEAQGNLTEARIAQDGAIISYLTNRHELGDSNTEIIKDVQASLETVKQEDLAELGINQDLQEWKQQQLEAFTQVAGMFSSTREFAERLVGRGQVQGLDATKLDGLGDINQQELAIQAITFSLMAGHRADAVMKEASQAVGEMFGAESGLVLTTVEELSKTQSKTRGTIALLRNHIKNYTAQADKLRQQILDETAKAENKTGDEVKGDKISELSTKLINLEQKIATERQKLEEVARNLNIAKSSSNQAQSALFPTIDNINIISAEDLLNLDENINTLQQSVDQLREVNPEVATRAENILKEFNSAKNAWKSHKATVDMISQGKINLPSVNTRLGALMKKGATIDEANKQWLTEVLQDYANRVFNNLYEQAETIKQEATQETVLNKLRKNESLTKEEQELYDQNKEEIDTLLKQEPATPPTDEPQPLSQLDYLKQRYEEVKKGTLALSEPADNPESPRPSNKELEEFKNLYEKQLQEPLTGEETLRYDELLQRIQEWRLVGSFIDNGSGMSLADLIELIAQHEQQEAVEETKSTFTPQDVENATSNIDEFGRKDDHSLGQNVTASVTVRKDKNTGKITVHHLSPLSIAGNNFTVKRGKETLTNPKTIEIDDIVTTESGVTFKVIAGRNLEFNKIDDLTNLGLVIVNSGVQWSFSDIYYDNGSELVKRPSDLTEPNLQPEYAFEVKQGQEVRFEIDRNDEYTKQLLDKYNKSKKEEDLKALQDGIKVYIVIDGKKVNTLKAQRGVSDENVTALRQQAAEVALQDEFTNDIGAKTTVLNTFLGSPQLILQTVERENGTVDVQVTTKPVTQTATENIITKGYIQNGELTLSEEVSGDVNTMYVSKMSRTPENQNSKIPVVVVKRGVNYLALPIKMTQVPLADSTIEEELSTISAAESEIEVAKAINNIIIKYNLPLDKVIPNNAIESVEKLEEELIKHTTSVSAERVAQKDYNKSNLQADAEMYIDIDNLNEVIKDAKVRIDITNIEFEDGTGIQNMSKENLETEMDNVLAQMRSKIYTAPVSQTEQLENFFQPFNDNLEVVGEEIETDIKFEVLKEMFSGTLKPADKNFFGNEIVSKAKVITQAYENVLKQVNPNSSLKNSGKKNTKC